MNLEISLKRVDQLLSRFDSEIKGETSMGRTDLNKAAETILIPLLNEIYRWNLENINYVEEDNNYPFADLSPGIDLVDKSERVCVQVTATTSAEKVKHTLRQFTKYEHYLEYDRLIIFFLKERKQNYPIKTIQRIVGSKLDFNIKRDLWDYRNLLQEISNFQVEKVNRVLEILEANFGGDRSAKPRLDINWRETCQALLEQWKGLTTNALTKPNGVRFQLDEVFVPLGVVERQKNPRHSPFSGSPEQGAELYDEKVTPISQDEFFEQVLRQGQSQYSQGKRIAIIGEPGAGKTTQLQKIGDWVLKETDGIPIWIPLSAMSTKALKDYLSQDWLQMAIPELEVSEQHRYELEQLLKTRQVWLLLDGVDEMAVSDALHHLAKQMKGVWLQNVRVVLTCRLNVWEAGKNALDNFDVYRNLDFDYPAKIYQFIDKWFGEEPDLQLRLKKALEQPGKERIRDIIKNPLRLTLLCYSWQIRQGEIPDTKAELYKWFVDVFYRWNKGKLPYKLTSIKLRELNQALGELAKEAIDQKSSRFRLKEEFTTYFLGDMNDEDSLFNLALQLGWLNRVGVAEENPFEDVYAFLHPTFQEYFAALAINDWDYFLPRKHENHPIENSEGEIDYRIFKLEWREVLALWIGSLPTNVKSISWKELSKKLIDFEDGLGGFFYFRASFLLGEIVEESGDNDTCDLIANRLIEWIFGTSDDAKKGLKPFKPVSESAKISFSRIPYNAKIKAILNRFSKSELKNLGQDEGLALVYILKESKMLEKAGFDVLNLLAESKFLLVSSMASNALKKQDLYPKKSSLPLADDADKGELSQIELGSPGFKDFERKAKEISSEMKYLSRISTELETIDDVDYLRNYLQSSNQRYVRIRVVFRISELVDIQPSVIDSIISLIDETKDEEIFELIAWLLGNISLNSLKSIESLIQIFKVSNKLLTLKQAVDSIRHIHQESLLKEMVFGLKDFLSKDVYNNFPQKYSLAFEAIWHCSHNMSYSSFYQAWNTSYLHGDLLAE